MKSGETNIEWASPRIGRLDDLHAVAFGREQASDEHAPALLLLSMAGAVQTTVRTPAAPGKPRARDVSFDVP
jgi:hypothetical protein